MSSIKLVRDNLSEIEQNILKELESHEADVLKRLQVINTSLKTLPLNDFDIKLTSEFNEVESFWKELKTAADSSDNALSKLKLAIKILENVTILHKSSVKILDCFKSEKYENISDEIEKYIQAVETSESSGHWDDVSRVISRGHISKDITLLRNMVLDKLKSKTATEQSQLLTKLAVVLGAEKEAYDSYLSSVRIETGADKKSSAHNIAHGGEISALTRVIENARNLILGQAAAVHSELGGVYYMEICREIHNTASIEASRIFMSFIKSQFALYLRDTEDEIMPQLEKLLQDPSVIAAIVGDMMALEKLLDDMAGISSLWIDFEVALSDITAPVYKTLVIKDDVDCGDDGLAKLSCATKNLQSILNVYVQLEHALATSAIHQAVEVADTIYLTPEDTYGVVTSTIVDDIFFILQKSQHRAIGTGDIQAACATFNQVAGILSNDLKDILMHNLIESQAIYERWTRKLENLSHGWYDMLEEYFKNMKQTLPETVGSKYSFIHCLNNLEECYHLLIKFQGEMNECFNNEFARERHSKSLLIDNTIQALDTVKSEYEDMQDTACKCALNILKEHIAEPLNFFSRIDFNLDEEGYVAYQEEDLFIDELIRVLLVVFKHIDNFYAPTIGLKCMTKLVERICQYIESSIKTKKFTIYGAVHLDGIVRSLFSTCSDFDQQIRKQFNVLLQIIDVLNVNDEAELLIMKSNFKIFSVNCINLQ